MRYLIIILALTIMSCNKFEKCETIYNGNDIYECCGQGIGAQKEVCDCFDEYNKRNNTNYETQCK